MQPVNGLPRNAVTLRNPFPLERSQHPQCFCVVAQGPTEDRVLAVQPIIHQRCIGEKNEIIRKLGGDAQRKVPIRDIP